MQKLHLVGFTTDHEGLILSTRRGARSGSYRVVVDEELATAVEEARSRQLEEAEAEAEVEEIVRPPRVESLLGVKEIQNRLRQGRSVTDVARAAGVDPSWVDRFAAPVFAEQAQVITSVLEARLQRPRLGSSTMTIGDAVRAGLVERGVGLTAEELRAAWSARQLADGRWVVRASFRVRSKDVKLRYDLADATGEITAHDRTSAMLGYVPPPAKAPAPRATAAARRPAAKRATITSGFRPDGTTKATSPAAKERERAALAMGKAAVKRAAEAEKANERRARQKRLDAERQVRDDKAAARQAEREAAAAAKAKAAAEKARAAEKAAAEKARAAEKAAAARAKAAEQAAAKKARAAAAKTRAAEQAAAKKASEAAAKAKAAARAKAAVERAAARDKAAADRAKAKADKLAASQKRRAEAALAAAERARATAAKAASKPAAPKPGASKPTATKAAVRKATATKPTATKATVRKATATKPTATKPTAPRATATKAARTKAMPTKVSTGRATPVKAVPRPAAPAPAAPTTRKAPAKKAASVLVPKPPPASAVVARPTRPPAADVDRLPPVGSEAPADVPELDGQLELLPATGPAADVYGERSSRAVFRAGLVEPSKDAVSTGWAIDEAVTPTPAEARPEDVRAAADGDGVAHRPPPDRPRRTEPLRAT